MQVWPNFFSACHMKIKLSSVKKRNKVKQDKWNYKCYHDNMIQETDQKNNQDPVSSKMRPPLSVVKFWTICKQKVAAWQILKLLTFFNSALSISRHTKHIITSLHRSQVGLIFYLRFFRRKEWQKDGWIVTLLDLPSATQEKTTSTSKFACRMVQYTSYFKENIFNL